MPNNLHHRIQLALDTLRLRETEARMPLENPNKLADLDVARRSASSARLQAHEDFANAVESILGEGNHPDHVHCQ